MTERNAFVDSRQASTYVQNVDTDASGDVQITVGGLRQIEDQADVSASASGGYVANVQSVSGNTVTVRIFQSGGSATVMSAVTGGTDVTDVKVHSTGQ